MTEQKIKFKNNLGQNIVGLLTDHGKDFIVVHCHGYGANKDGKTATSLSAALSKDNISSFVFDFSDSGESECKKADLTVSIGLDDLKSAIRYLESVGFENFALSGSSFGGSVVLNYATKDQNIKAIVLKAPVSDWPKIIVFGVLRSGKFLDDAKQYTIYDKAKQINCPVLIFHGDKDETVPIEQSQKVCALIKNCQLKVIKGADHQLADHRNDLAADIAEFFSKAKND